MYTDCPACNRQFHLNAKQLSAAGGMVRCGYCGQQYNAVERLHDKPLSVEKGEIPDVLEQTQSGLEPQFFIPDEQGTDAETDALIEPVKKTRPDNENLVETETNVTSSQEEAVNKEEVPGLESQERNPYLTDDLTDEPPANAGTMGRILWISGTLILVLVATTQIAWFKRDEILARYPQWMPVARQICEHIQCEMIRHRDVSAIKLLNRDVRDHPRYENALLVNATMSNQSHTIQPFPDIQLVLFDTNGEQIAHRNFHPEDYLDSSINLLDGMIPDVSVHFVLEVTGPTEGAVSFEFNFF